ncbi:unnamed protein product [Paramecium primaurelia]|uniref:Ubiquitin carboxyl-terminal hydrolase n=1 Tax=Paramecium primaurelia TaxID=5886 RepID=A0A8S1MPK1_PARPR|nr:unnamed protein product [Paramecium primaurelia]
MQKQGSCSHFSKYKLESIGNLIKTNFTFCDNAKKLQCESDVEKWLCIECGFFGCSRNSNNQCSLKHNQQTNHPLSISNNSFAIWCYVCDNDLETIIEETDNKGQKEKIIKFLDSMKNLLFKKIKQNKPTQTIQQFQQVQQQQQQPETLNQDIKQQTTQPLNYTPKQVFGLRNLGNTCFFNSVMQCLNATESLNQFYLDHKKFNFSSYNNNVDNEDDDDWTTVETNKQIKQQVRPKSSKLSINQIYQNFLLNSRKSKGLVDPADLFKSIQAVQGRFRSMAQQDASELLRCLLDALSTGEENTHIGRINKTKTNGKPKRTIVENIFGSYLCNYLECLDCGFVSRTFDFCLDYTVQIRKPKGLINQRFQEEYSEITSEELQDVIVPYLHNSILVQKNNNPPKIQQQKQCNLSVIDCLDAFTEYEELNQKNNYFKCEQCAKQGKKSVRALRKFFLYDLPQVATIILKRFQQKSAGRFEKVTEQVEIPETIYLEDYTILKGEPSQTIEEIQAQKFKYQLYGVVVHQGTMTGGHYVSYVKHKENNQDHWFYFSDSNFKEVSLKQALSNQAYILFYERV